MLDTIGIILEKVNSKQVDKLIHSIETNGIIERHDKQQKDGIFFLGTMKNMIVKVQVYQGYSFKVFIMGSLTKYYYSTNLYNLNRHLIRQVFENLALDLSIPFKILEHARVYRIDLGINIEVKHAAEEYIKHFSGASYFRKEQRYVNNAKGENHFEDRLPNGLTYSSNNRAIVIYDKLKEVEDKGLPIPNEFSDKNLLRLEYQIQKRVKNKFKEPVYVFMLWDGKFLEQALEKWKAEYKRIRKVNHQINDLDSSESLTDFQPNFMMLGMETIGGQKGVEDFLSEMLGSGKIDKNRYRNLLDRIRKYYKRYASPHPNIQELNTKVEKISIRDFSG